MSLLYHPDKNNSDEAQEKFIEVAQAYEVVGDPDKRKRYDAGGFGSFEGPDGANFDFGPGFEDLTPEQKAELMKQAMEQMDRVLDIIEDMLSDSEKMFELVNEAFGESDLKKQG